MKKLIALLLLISALFTLSACGEDEVSYVEICFEDYGSCVVLINHTAAPITANNFITLVSEGFYDGLTIHRVIEDFMIQGGDPKGDGTGGKVDENGKKQEIFGEFSANGYENKISHTRGVISMARGTDNNSASSQFFICNADARASLDGKYAAFGYVVDGMNVIDAITEEVFPKTALAEYYGTENHQMWAMFGNGAIESDEDKPVIKYIKVLENYENSR